MCTCGWYVCLQFEAQVQNRRELSCDDKRFLSHLPKPFLRRQSVVVVVHKTFGWLEDGWRPASSDSINYLLCLDSSSRMLGINDHVFSKNSFDGKLFLGKGKGIFHEECEGAST